MTGDVTTTSLPSSSSYTGSDCQLEDENTATLSNSLGYEGSSYTNQDLDFECNMKDDDYPDCDYAKSNASARVLGHLG
jgi:hypothetical protein